MMRKTSLILIFILAVSSLFGQVDRPQNLTSFDYKQLHWGFTVGLNSMDFAIDRNPAADDFMHADVIGFQPSGFQVNIVSDLRLSDNWNLRFLPGINLGSRNLVFFAEDENYEYNPDYTFSINSAFLDFPLLVKYRSERVNNYRPYLIGGMSYRIDMSAKRGFDMSNIGGNEQKINLKKGDFYVEMGFGLDTYSQYFKFAPEIKLCIGLRNMLLNRPGRVDLYPNEPQYVESIASMRSFLVLVNFHFE